MRLPHRCAGRGARGYDAIPTGRSATRRRRSAGGRRAFYLPSGAGHDVGMFAGATDIGMLFVRCGNGGISRSPLETMTAADADMGARVLLDVLLNLV